MAEAIGLASGIVALVQLSASVYSATSKFYREAKDARSKISALATQARNLSGVLQSLSLLASAPLFDDAGVSSPDFRDTHIEACHITLQRIKRQLDKAERDVESGSRRKLVTRSLKWPFAAQETNELIAELGQHQDVLQLALSAETMSQLMQCLANTKRMTESIGHLSQKLDRKATIDMRAELTKKREEIVRFFLKVNPEAHLHDCRGRRQPNTGRWLIERNETFRDWLNSPGSHIWLSGIPGAGKTILCGTVIEEVLQQQTTSTAVAFFFCDYKYAQSHEPINVLGALAVQLAKQGDGAFELLESYYEELHPENGIQKPPETKAMVEVTRAIINEYDNVYLVVDGLDECGARAIEVIHSLRGLAISDRVTMALFSRNEPDIADELSDILSIEIAAHTEDLELYVLAQMESRKRLGSLAVKNANLHDHILRTLIQEANGMFRWVACQLDYLDGLPSDGRRRKALTELPPTLFETYDRILDRIMQEDEHSQEICRKALHWIGLGYERMSAEALCEAVSIPDDQDTVEEELLVDADWLSRSCSSLIRLAGQDYNYPHFQLAHFTVKEYMRSIKSQSKRSLFRFSKDEAIRSLTRTSVRFLTFPIFNQAPLIASSELQRMAQRNEEHPFYPVAAAYIFSSGAPTRYWAADEVWANELALVFNDEGMKKYATKLFDPDKNAVFLSWVLQAMWDWPDDCGRFEEDFARIIGLLIAPEFSTLHVAASLALPSICKYLIETEQVDINTSCRLGTPLHALLAGVSIYGPGGGVEFSYSRYYHYRWYGKAEGKSSEQCRQCLETFIQNCADTSARWGSISALQMAIDHADHPTASWMVPLIAPSTAIDEAQFDQFKAALATNSVDESFVDAILAIGSDTDAPPMWGRLASHIQTSRMEQKGHNGGKVPANLPTRLTNNDFADALRICLNQNLTDTLEFLVQDPRFRPDIYIPTGDDAESEPILHFAVRAGSLRLIEILLEAGCDQNVVDGGCGWTALHQSAWWNTNNAAITRLLLKSGVADSIKDNMGQTCWHNAAKRGSVPVLEALIELGSDTAISLRIVSKQGRAPLASAILNGKVDSALLLLDHCNDELDVFRSDESLLEKAVSIGSGDLFPRLDEKMKSAGAIDALTSSKPLDNINMGCSPKLVAYLLTTWATDGNSRSHALMKYLLDVKNFDIDDPNQYSEPADLVNIIRQLMKPAGAMDDQVLPPTFWEAFCQKVVFNFSKPCDHLDHRCRKGLLEMIFSVLIGAGVLDSYERNMHHPSYATFFKSLLDRGEDVKCLWIPPLVDRVIKTSALSKDLADDTTAKQLLSRAVIQSNTALVRRLLENGVSVHSSCLHLSPLEQACYSSDLPTFTLVVSHADRSRINEHGTEGKTLLHWAVSGNGSGCSSKIHELLELGADIDAKVDSLNADTALTLASRDNREDVAALLVSKGANMLHGGRDGWTILHAAARTGGLQYIQILHRSQVPESFWHGTCETALFKFPTVNGSHVKTVQNTAAVHLAAASGKSHFLRFISDHRLPLDVNAVTGYPNVTPLHLASFFGHIDVVEFLISEKANVNARDAFGSLPIDIAARGHRVAIVKSLLKAGSETPSEGSTASMALLMSEDREDAKESEVSKDLSRFTFEQSIINGNLDRCKLIVKRPGGLSINAKLLKHSYTPLVRAVVEGQAAIVDWLVSLKVEARNPVIDGLHPSMRCIASLATHYIQSPRTISALMTLALTQGVSWCGSILSPLHVAILDNNMQALEVILEHIRENDHAYRRMIKTELICAPADIINWRVRTARSILVNSFNREEALSGNPIWEDEWPPGSPLHWAIRYSDIDAVRLLLEHEADVNQADSAGMTPLRLAISSEHPTELVQELLQAGAGISEPSGSRISAMKTAIRSGDLELVEILAEADPETLKGVDQYCADLLLQSTPSAAVFQFLVSQGADPFKAKEAFPGDSAVASMIGPNSGLSGFAINSGLVIQSSEDSLASALIELACDGGQESVSLVKRLHRAICGNAFIHAVNKTSREVGSPLCLAASFDAARMAEALINAGAELDSEGCRYGSPLMAACAWGNLDAARVLVRAGALVCYVNEVGMLRSAISAASRHQKVINWLLVGRYTEQLKIDYQPSQATSHETAWSGPRLFKLALPTYMHRDFDESRWGHLRRLQEWREKIRGCALADSRRNSGLDFYTESEAESRIEAAEAAHQSFLMKLGETREKGRSEGSE